MVATARTIKPSDDPDVLTPEGDKLPSPLPRISRRSRHTGRPCRLAADFQLIPATRGRCFEIRPRICRTTAREKDKNTTRCSVASVRATSMSAMVLVLLPGPHASARFRNRASVPNWMRKRCQTG